MQESKLKFKRKFLALMDTTCCKGVFHTNLWWNLED